MTTLIENIKRIAGDTPAVVIAGRMTSAGCNTHQNNVQSWLDEEFKPSAEKMPYLAAALGVTLDDLYEGVMPVEVQ